MKKAAVLGIGLIGGSLALCLKERTHLESATVLTRQRNLFRWRKRLD